jgi:hypothetical protein
MAEAEVKKKWVDINGKIYENKSEKMYKRNEI